MHKIITFITSSFLVLTSSGFATFSGSDEQVKSTPPTIPIINLDDKSEATAYFCKKAFVGANFRLQGDASQAVYEVSTRTFHASNKRWSVEEDILSERLDLLEFLSSTFKYSNDTILNKIFSLTNTPNANYDIVRKNNTIAIQHNEGDCNYMFFISFSNT